MDILFILIQISTVQIVAIPVRKELIKIIRGKRNISLVYPSSGIWVLHALQVFGNHHSSLCDANSQNMWIQRSEHLASN